MRDQKKIHKRYTPQQNGVVERKSIINISKIMLKEKNMSIYFQGEEVACLVYVLNISPSKSVNNKVPQEDGHA